MKNRVHNLEIECSNKQNHILWCEDQFVIDGCGQALESIPSPPLFPSHSLPQASPSCQRGFARGAILDVFWTDFVLLRYLRQRQTENSTIRAFFPVFAPRSSSPLFPFTFFLADLPLASQSSSSCRKRREVRSLLRLGAVNPTLKRISQANVDGDRAGDRAQRQKLITDFFKPKMTENAESSFNQSFKRRQRRSWAARSAATSRSVGIFGREGCSLVVDDQRAVPPAVVLPETDFPG